MCKQMRMLRSFGMVVIVVVLGVLLQRCSATTTTATTFTTMFMEDETIYILEDVVIQDDTYEDLQTTQDIELSPMKPTYFVETSDIPITNSSQLPYDTAALRVQINKPNSNSYYFNFGILSANCYDCNPAPLFESIQTGTITPYVEVDTRFGSTLFIELIGSTSVTSISHQFDEFGFYTLNITFDPNVGVFPSIQVAMSGDDAFYPLYFLPAVLFGIAILTTIITSRYMRQLVSSITNVRQTNLPESNSSTLLETSTLHNPLLDDSIYNSTNYEADGAIKPRRKRPHITISTRASTGRETPLNVNNKGAPDQILLIEENPSFSTDNHIQPSTTEELRSTPQGRLTSLDVFRGISLAIMIFVNYGGGNYWFFNHSSWNGLTVADLVFPWFIFIMGAAMPLSFNSMNRKNVRQGIQFVRVLKRAGWLFLLGLIVSNNNGVDLHDLRIMGVLQRFSLSYLIVGLILIFVPKFGSPSKHRDLTWYSDVSDHVLEYAVAVLLLVAHEMLTFFLPVPGCPTGYIGPGGPYSFGDVDQCTGGAAGYIDRTILGLSHVYKSPTCIESYECSIPYDPEGLLGVLTSAALCYIGVICGRITIYYPDATARIKRWFMWCLICGIVGGSFCEFKQNGGLIPVNKNLWSLTFVTTLACFAFFVMILLYLLIDVKKLWQGYPFRSMGKNSIVVYFASEMLNSAFPFDFTFNADDKPTHSELYFNVYSTVIFMIIAGYMDYINFYIAL